MLMPDPSAETAEDLSPKMAAEDGHLEAKRALGKSAPADLLAQAIEEHGSEDPQVLLDWLKEYGYELTPSAESEGMALDGEEALLDEDAEEGTDAMFDEEAEVALGDEEDEGEEEDPMSPDGGIMNMRKNAASRAFAKHYGGQS